MIYISIMIFLLQLKKSRTHLQTLLNDVINRLTENYIADNTIIQSKYGLVNGNLVDYKNKKMSYIRRTLAFETKITLLSHKSLLSIIFYFPLHQFR